jgi:hypothetical protein
LGVIAVVFTGLMRFFSAVTSAQSTSPLPPYQGPYNGQVGMGRMKDYVAGCPPESARFRPCAATKAKTFKPPRLPDGHPDMQGYWDAPTTTGSQHIEDFPGGGELDFGPSVTLVVSPADGKIPFQPWAQERRQNEYLGKMLDQSPLCVPLGPPRQMYYFRSRHIIQLPEGVVITSTANVDMHRVIYTDGRPHLSSKVSLWMGDNRGHWERNTLVNDITNLNAKTWFDFSAAFHSKEMHVVERYTMIDRDVIAYEATMDDPKVFTTPWTIAFPLVRNSEAGYEAWEEQCVEGNHDLDTLLQFYKPFPGPVLPQ